jgi:hypothetical protein
VVAELAGILKVHVSMEDASLYPSLLSHPDPTLQTLARRYLDERAAIERAFEHYRTRFSSAAMIAAAPEAFVEASREVLGVLYVRMQQEDNDLHPEILKRWASPAPNQA